MSDPRYHEMRKDLSEEFKRQLGTVKKPPVSEGGQPDDKAIGLSLPPEHGLQRGDKPKLTGITPLVTSPSVQKQDTVKTTTHTQKSDIKAEDANGETHKGRQTKSSTYGTKVAKTETIKKDDKPDPSVPATRPSKDGQKQVAKIGNGGARPKTGCT